jgi:hypothetical protein
VDSTCGRWVSLDLLFDPWSWPPDPGTRTDQFVQRAEAGLANASFEVEIRRLGFGLPLNANHGVLPSDPSCVRQ